MLKRNKTIIFTFIAATGVLLLKVIMADTLEPFNFKLNCRRFKKHTASKLVREDKLDPQNSMISDYTTYKHILKPINANPFACHRAHLALP